MAKDYWQIFLERSKKTSPSIAFNEVAEQLKAEGYERGLEDGERLGRKEYAREADKKLADMAEKVDSILTELNAHPFNQHRKL